jgi:hypothetical protein
LTTGFWLRHFGLYLSTERLLSDLFTVIVIAGATVVLLAVFGGRRRTAVIAGLACAIVLSLVGGAYVAVGAQFRSASVRADDALARTVPAFPGAERRGADLSVDYNNGDGPISHHLSFTNRFPLAWNYDRRIEYSLPAGTSAQNVLRFYRERFTGWRSPGAAGQAPSTYWLGRRAVEITPSRGTLVVASGPVDRLQLVVTGWTRPASE